MTSPLDRPVANPGPDVRKALAALRVRLREPVGPSRERQDLRRLADRLRRTCDVGTDEQVVKALEWLRAARAKESAEQSADGVREHLRDTPKALSRGEHQPPERPEAHAARPTFR